MRFIKFIGPLMLAFLAQVGVAQSQPERAFATETSLQESVQIYPNPTVDYVHIKIESLPSNKLKLAVHNILGNEVPVELEIIGDHEVRVKVKDLASGYYLLAVKDEEAHFRGTYRILKLNQ